tara:strand:+ start:4211 stop:5281 length:1071 start_codon:yes stop_codon:yes gene_type:complete
LSFLQSDHSFILNRYKNMLPVTADTPLVTLGEGATPLIKSTRLVEMIGLRELYFKAEFMNPTGSFKDRGMVLAVAKAVESGSRAVICASTGNTSASAAAYGSKHGLEVIVVVPEGRIAQGKLVQAIAYGAKIVSLDGSFDDALTTVRELCQKHPVALVNSVNSDRIEGQKTAAFEIIDDLGKCPDILALPVGNAGNITAYWKGFKEYFNLKRVEFVPELWGFQATGASPIVQNVVVKNPETIATAIRIGNPASWSQAIEARDASNGKIESVTDNEIMNAYSLLAKEEGIFCEPASAASVAGLLKNKLSGIDFSDKTAVCVLTGHGLKDPDVALQLKTTQLESSSNINSLEKALDWH